MGFLSALGSIGKIGAGIAAPFTGGLSALAIPAIDAIGAIGKTASGAAKGSADQRANDAQMQALFHQLALQSARDQANFSQQGARDQYASQLQGAQFGANEQQRGTKNQILAQLLGGVQDATMTGMPSRIPKMEIQGGLRPSALGGNREALMALLQQPTMQAPTFTPGAGYQAPPTPQAPTAGIGEKVLGGVGLGGSILGALGGLLKPKLHGQRVGGIADTYNTQPRI